MYKREKHFANKFNKANLGFKYVSGYINSDSHMLIQCEKCGQVLDRTGGFLRKVIRGEKNIWCHECKGRERTNQFKEPTIRECKYCGKTFETTSCNQVYCCDKCYSKHRNQKIDNRKRLKQYKLIDNNSYDSSISLNALIVRDKNICHICGDKCNSKDYILDKDNSFIVGSSYPSIDHVVPISKGGTHTWDNVKLAHHYCNAIKNNNEVYEEREGQLKMII